jgi:hypothetical protein
VNNFTLQPFYSQAKNAHYPPDWRLDVPQSQSGCSGREKNPTSARNKTLTIYPAACHLTDCTNPVLVIYKLKYRTHEHP